jgi:hypothetical protein
MKVRKVLRIDARFLFASYAAREDDFASVLSALKKKQRHPLAV